MRFLALAFILFLPSLAVGQIEEIFVEVDADEDGLVTQSELERAGRRSGWVAFADIDGDSAVSLIEAKSFFERPEKKKHRAYLEARILIGEFPEESAVTEASCRAAAEYSSEKNGYTFLVMENGEVVFERYDQGWQSGRAHRLASGTKSFSGAIIAAAAKDGLLSMDEPVSRTITEWQSDEKLSAVTIRQLLSLTSGIPGGSVGKVPSYREAIDTEVVFRPGKKFSYGPVPYQIFGELMRRKLTARDDLDFADPLAYLADRIFQPIGMEFANWRRHEDGMPHLPSGAFLTAREWAKFGQLLLQNGEWEGRQLLDSQTLAECLKCSEANPGYGVTFWLIEANENFKLEGAYMAAGAGKQRLYVLPEVDTLVVRQGESRKFDDLELLEKLLGDSR